MSSTLSHALSGMQAAQTRLGASAHNLANLATPGFQRQTVQLAAPAQGGVKTALATAPNPGSALEQDVVEQMVASHSFAANLLVFKAQDRMSGALLNARA
jgi:flagellar hook protein FlgE